MSATFFQTRLDTFLDTNPDTMMTQIEVLLLSISQHGQQWQQVKGNKKGLQVHEIPCKPLIYIW